MSGPALRGSELPPACGRGRGLDVQKDGLHNRPRYRSAMQMLIGRLCSGMSTWRLRELPITPVR
jgi:hypothetical protein